MGVRRSSRQSNFAFARVSRYPFGGGGEGLKTGLGPRNIPLLYSKGLVFSNAKADHLTLGVEGIEINVGDDPQRTRC